MKAADYVVKHRLVSSMSMRNMLDAVRQNEGSEVLLYCPQFEELYYDIKMKFEFLVGRIEGFYDAIKDIDEIKPFALVAKEQYFSGILFNLRHGNVSNVREALSDMNIKVLEEWLSIT